MSQIILRPNAAPLYSFLSYLIHSQTEGGGAHKRKVLDCGAGGPLPPLAVFYEQGFETWGIDVSAEQLQKARAFCREHGMDIHLRQGDMRQIPFEDETFDIIYEQYSMCHLTKTDTVQAIGEMHRVLKPGGLCFLGVISTDTWPLPGEEGEPGEYWSDEHGERVVHSLFSDDEADRLLDGWEIVTKENRTMWYRAHVAKISLEDWMDLWEEADEDHSKATWQALYVQRTTKVRYTHQYYIVKKQA
jgi:ubiquinone/menaquinone biosynthesis C-methylase UbiE